MYGILRMKGQWGKIGQIVGLVVDTDYSFLIFKWDVWFEKTYFLFFYDFYKSCNKNIEIIINFYLCILLIRFIDQKEIKLGSLESIWDIWFLLFVIVGVLGFGLVLLYFSLGIQEKLFSFFGFLCFYQKSERVNLNYL